MLSKVLWNSLLVTPAVLGAALLSANPALASDAQGVSESADALLTELTATSELDTLESVLQADTTSINEVVPAAAVSNVAPESPVQLAQVSTEQAAPAASTSVDSLDQINQYASEGNQNVQGQVTSISQLSDVQPTDWAFQALQSLVERYGVIAGYPDGTYRGNRAMTRYEFAAGLNAALDRVNELIAAGLADAVTREDLATLQRLQEEFAAELATLRGRVDALEARTAELEANQFSTTTQLRGETIFSVSGVIEEDDSFDSQVTFGYRARLNLDTSFTGDDLLTTRLQARNIQDFDSDPVGFSYSGDSDGDFEIDNLIYSFPVGNRVQVTIGANSMDIDEFVASTISPLDSSGSGSVSNFGFPQQYAIAATGNAGAGAIIQLTDNLSLDFGYTAGEAASPDAGSGLFDGDYSAIGQLTFLSDAIDAALTFIHSYSGEDFSVDGRPGVANTYGGQVNFKLFPALQLGGGVAFSNIQGIGASPDFEAWSWQVTAALPDFGGEGNLLGILAGVPPYSRDLIDETSFLVEGFYKYQLTDNISVTPSIIWINDPFTSDIDDTFIGTLRTTFSF
ncbi:iron uptake porin [Oculatella sp. LEGE 06141]|uniref:iron uptake porin n=1 Tax=Oculatella sp. LEGE 06141 TaxID=1828648 RepID=UPI00188010FF|nr:iron uptake porin [Oculatella sp. LEGE 06141]MBE9181800.1 iron uptake porin [Oculatella sp. LEGE 06141]